jgi:uncharacterized tellurite resistance protein B-like protein
VTTQHQETGAAGSGEPMPGRASAQNVAVLLACLIAADGDIDPDELAIAHKACKSFGFPPAVLDAALAESPADPMARFAEALLGIGHPAEREQLASFMFEIASVDERLDQRETTLLEAMRQAWGVSVAFLNRPIEWDADQIQVIEAGRSARILVSAGPGMGKTAVACSRVANLVDRQNVADTNIWLVSFTRSAIAELKGRIGDFAEDPSNVSAVKISTIDSQAWKIRYGFSPEQAEALFGGFETGIDNAITLIEERIDDFREAFGDLEHLIIDEAQDITGGRARFLLKLIEILPPRCGVTVFHDPAQAIYDYAAAGDALFRFTDGLSELLGAGLQERSLKKIYRTNEPALLKLYEDLRLDILGNADQSSENFKAKAELVKQAAVSVRDKGFDQNALAGYDDALVLFRKRIEVAQASSFMASDGIPHRLRMSGLPRMPLPWLALVLGPTNGRTLTKAEFVERCEAARAIYPVELIGEDIAGNSAEARWDRLCRYAKTSGGDLDLYRLRGRLASAPPDEFVMPEFGHRGPILGTIHASKGREADHVFLQINDNWSSDRRESGEFSEEARVLFVGATRAKQSLAVQGGFAMEYATQTESGRSYRRKFKNSLQFHLGLQGDYDPYSAARITVPIETLAGRTLPFKCGAAREEGSYIYALRTEDGAELGSLTKKVSYDMFEIGKKAPKKGRIPPMWIKHISVMGFGTMVAPVGDERLVGARVEPAASGFWLVPQIIGLPMVYLSW